MTIKPLADRVLIQPDEVAKKTVGGIIMTEVEKPVMGVIISTGEGTPEEPMKLKAGDKVIYGRISGIELPVNGKNVLMMRQSDCLAIITS
jgi:chaperonin GroES